MEIMNFLVEKKKQLILSGNIYRYHFIDITQAEFDEINPKVNFFKDFAVTPLMPFPHYDMGIDHVVKYAGITWLFRIKENEDVRNELREIKSLAFKKECEADLSKL